MHIFYACIILNVGIFGDLGTRHCNFLAVGSSSGASDCENEYLKPWLCEQYIHCPRAPVYSCFLIIIIIPSYNTFEENQRNESAAVWGPIHLATIPHQEQHHTHHVKNSSFMIRSTSNLRLSSVECIRTM